MFSVILPDAIDPSIQGVYWTILATFFILTILSWAVMSKTWFKDDTATPQNDREIETSQKNNLE